MATTRTARELLTEFQRCLLAKDGDGFAAILAPDATMEFPFAPPGTIARREGREAIRAAARESWQNVPLRFEELRAVSVHDGKDPDVVFGEHELRGTRDADGAPFLLRAAVLLTARDGLVAVLREYLDPVALVTLRRPASAHAVWRDAIACYRRGDIDGYADAFAPDGTIAIPFAPPGIPRRIEGKDEIRRVLGPLWERARQSGRRVLGVDRVVLHEAHDPELAVIEFDVRGERGGKPYRLSYVHVVRVRDGRIVSLHDYVDSWAIANART